MERARTCVRALGWAGERHPRRSRGPGKPPAVDSDRRLPNPNSAYVRRPPNFTASSIAARMLDASAVPAPAMSSAVP